MLGPKGERRGGAGKKKPGEEKERETGREKTRKGRGEIRKCERGHKGLGGLALLPYRHAFVLSANPESPLYSGESPTERGVQYQLLLHFKEFKCLPSSV